MLAANLPRRHIPPLCHPEKLCVRGRLQSITPLKSAIHSISPLFLILVYLFSLFIFLTSSIRMLDKPFISGDLQLRGHLTCNYPPPLVLQVSGFKVRGLILNWALLFWE